MLLFSDSRFFKLRPLILHQHTPCPTPTPPHTPDPATTPDPVSETPPTPCAPQKRVTHPSRGHFLFGDAPGMLRVPSAEEWDLLREELLVEGRVRVVDALPTSAEGNQSRCEKCGCYAFDQFDDAACPVCRTAL